MEDYNNYINTAQSLNDIMGNRDWYYKASFDKANRKTITSSRGPGLELGLEFISSLKRILPNIKLTTDVHDCSQVERLVGYVDLIQIPAFLCRQTDLLVECGKYFNIVNVKRGQWVSPKDTAYFASKIKSKNNKATVWITDRGTMFGYDKLLVDFDAASEIRNHCDKVLLDCTHSTQVRDGQKTGGNRALAEKYLLASSVFNYGGVFAEVHGNPPTAISDSDSQIYLSRISGLIKLREKLVNDLSNSIIE
jgi:2-dehydro-3-deoxyphosphooctonate aldolase (KDO 8-P synthase)